MNSAELRIVLDTNPAQFERLLALQGVFARACNALVPMVQQTRVWNRVALHHLSYRTLRQQFPALGSQMVCNAIYSVSRTCRIVYQHPQSPFNVSRLDGRPLPLLRFGANCPVYFDRHTLSVKNGELSMFTLDGRLRFALALQPADELAFKTSKLREIVLQRRPDGRYELAFLFGEQAEAAAEPAGSIEATESLASAESGAPQMAELPDDVMVEETA
jgi:hypothetical protein